MTRQLLIAAVLVVLAGACKERGVIDLDLSFPSECDEATHVSVYLIRGARCDECRCGQCLDSCRDDNCTIGCDGGYCTVDQLEEGISVVPDRAGSYAVVYQLVAIAGEDIEEVALLCGDDVQLDKDGTASSEVELEGSCCPLSTQDDGADAGARDGGADAAL